MCRSLELLRIVEWLNKMGIKNYTINDDLSVDVDGDVWLRNRKLKEIPIQFNKVGGWFECSHNQLTSLRGCPRVVGRWFDCSNNQLTSLEGCPREVGRRFSCSDNQLTSLKGCPKKVGGRFSCKNNKIEFNADDVRLVCQVGEEIYV